MKFARSAGFLFIYVVILLVVYVAYIRTMRVDVVFYSSLYVGVISSVISVVVLAALPIMSIFSFYEKAQLVLITVLLGYIFAISVPTVIDRSLSFYILEKLQQRGGGIQLDEFSYIFTNEYMRESRLVDVRLTEQVESGTIVIDGNCVRLTKKGDVIASFGQFFRKNFLPKQRLLRDRYTDELTDPFQKSVLAPDYLCDPG